jgi:hypothetical protein
MEKGKTSAVYLTQRDRGHVGKELKRVDWDGLVEDVFKEEVDHFIIETGVQTLSIRPINNIIKLPSQSIHRWTTQIPTSSSSAYHYNNILAISDFQNSIKLVPSSSSINCQECWQKIQEAAANMKAIN